MLVRLDLALMTEAAGRMAAGVAAMAAVVTVVVGVAGRVVAGSEGIRPLGCLKILLRGALPDSPA